MEQMLLSPLQGSAVVSYGANHRIVMCPDAAAERGSKMITETVRAYRNSSGASLAHQPQSSAIAPSNGATKTNNQSSGAKSPARVNAESTLANVALAVSNTCVRNSRVFGYKSGIMP